MEESEASVFVSLLGGIDEYSVAGMMQQIDSYLAADKSVKSLYLIMNSPGVGINAGITLHNYLRGLRDIKVIAHNIGQVDSIGNVVFLSGEERYAAPATSFLFHGVGFSTRQDVNYNVVGFEEQLSQMKLDEKRIETIIRDRTNDALGQRKLRDFFRVGRSISPDEAISLNIIHGVKTLIFLGMQRRLLSIIPFDDTANAP